MAILSFKLRKIVFQIRKACQRQGVRFFVNLHPAAVQSAQGKCLHGNMAAVAVFPQKIQDGLPGQNALSRCAPVIGAGVEVSQFFCFQQRKPAADRFAVILIIVLASLVDLL